MALSMARRGRGVAPHPRVGVILVRNGRVVARGFYRTSGALHAEQTVLRAAGRRARGATLYTTLEPCTWWPGKRTAPCTPAMLRAGVKRVVIAMEDPNPRVSGRGIQDLRRGGVPVTVGMCRTAATRLNTAYVRAARREPWAGRPFVVLSSAVTVDGKIAAPGRSVAISTRKDFARKDAFRASVDAILVGGTTMHRDDPKLTVRSAALVRERRRLGLMPQPAKVGLARAVRLSPMSAFLTHGPGKRYLFTTAETPPEQLSRLRTRATVSVARARWYPIRSLLRTLYADGIRTLLVEGGGSTAASFLAAGCVDDIVVRVRSAILGGASAPTMVDGAGFTPSRAVPLVLQHCESDADGTVIAHYHVERKRPTQPLDYA
ncbi:MAG: bifunctional diaminohydroxyphosphoribosylaminopyrimidine deaminase/5-amino-6-(5-phosphoribosylamino)uracil reductase RibD [Candidatus Kerfeldbacteria bacterium]|nr:bifunctional diaminohydroxyphosphoribosylaminopyrimidine deaminase/5-amino-6-(5-phosphoribosylamino)uracil reductase RibD [Candidatus Kerfeldbacteria bacterium]